MEAAANQYIHEVLDHMVVEERMKERIRTDLMNHISEACKHEDIHSILARMGSPKEVARDFMDSIYEDKNEVIERLIEERVKVQELSNDFFEYKSKIHILGLPLVHIKSRRRGTGKPAVAKGIIAMGEIAFGFAAIGAMPIGIISFGGVAIGLISLGGLSLGGLAFGGVAVGLAAAGGIAIGKIALGGLAIGKAAIGGMAKGPHILDGSMGGIPTRQEAIELIKSVYPRLSDWIVRILTLFFPA